MVDASAPGSQMMLDGTESEGRVPDPVPGFEKTSIVQLQNDLNTEFNSLKSGYDTAKTKRMQLWKEYRFQLYGNERDGQSKVVDSTIFNMIEWALPTLIQPFIETDEFIEVSPTSAELQHIVSAEVFRELLNIQVRRRNPYYLILYDTIKGMMVQGQSYTKLLWKDRDGDTPGHPVIKAVPASQIRYDWTVQNFEDSHVVTQEEDLSRSDILKLMKPKGKYAKGVIAKRFDMQLAMPGSNHKAGRLRDEEINQPNWVGEDDTKSSKAMSLYTRREHWTEYDMDGSGEAKPIMAVFINDVLVQVIENPYDFKRPPYAVAQAVRDPLGNPAFGFAEILSDIQKFRTAILRMTSDNLNAQHNGMYEVDMTNVDDIGRMLLENVPTGTRTGIPVRKPGSISPLQSAPIAQHTFSAWEIMAEAGENRSGMTRYSQGLDSKSLNQTATGIVQILQRSDMRSWELATRLAESWLKPMARMLISLNQQKLDDQSIQLQFGLTRIERLDGSNNKSVLFEGLSPGNWLTLSRKDIGGVFSVGIDVMVGADRQQSIENMLSYLQAASPFVGQGAPPEIISILLVELAKKMRLPKVQTAMRGSYVGTAGASIPSNAFTGSGNGPVETLGVAGGGVLPTENGSGVQASDLAGILGGLRG